MTIFPDHIFLEMFLSLILVLSLIWLLSVRRDLIRKNKAYRVELERRISAEKELIEKERKYHKLVETVGDGIGIVDENEFFLYANNAAEIIFECESRNLIGKNLSEFLNSEEMQKIKKGTENRKKGFSEKYELKIVTNKGNTKIIEVTVSPNYDDDGKFVSSYGVFRDVTELVDARIKLEESRELFRTLLNNAPLPIFYKDSKGMYLGCNSEFARMLGMKEDQIIGKTVYDIAPEEIALKYDEMDKELFEKGGTQIYEWKFANKSGGIRNVVFHKAALVDHLENITGLIGAIVDITEIKEYEKKLENSNRELQDFAYTVSHDLQEPLRMVSGFSDLLIKKYGSVLNDEAKTYINYSVDGAKRMQAQIQGLLAYSRVTTQRDPFGNVDLNEAVKEALKNLSSSVVETGAMISYDSLPVVLGDRSQIISVFQNLLGNAIKFRKTELVPEIHIKAEEAEIQGKVRITVEDNGIGMDLRHTGNIFRIFHRLHSQDKYPGTGIGLAIVKKIIERHGGMIRAESEKGKSTRFIFTLNRWDENV